MSEAITTPNLIDLAAPYYGMTRKVVDDAYGFKDVVRSDFLKDQYVPSKVVGAQLDYLNNQFALDEAGGTYGMRLGTSMDANALARANAGADLALNPVLRPLQDQAAVTGVQADVYGGSLAVDKAKSELELRALTRVVGTRVNSAPGLVPWEKGLNAYRAALSDKTATPDVKAALFTNVTNQIQRQMAATPPSSVEYGVLRNALVSLGQYGVSSGPGPRTSPGSAAVEWTP